MNSPLRQSDRLGRLITELGADTLTLLRFDGSDHLNELFEYRVEALATRDDLDFDALVGTHATVEIEGREGVQHFDGIVTQARWAGVGENGHRYDLMLRPWFWLAGRRRNQRIFYNKTVVQILQELLSDYAQLGDPALDVQLSQDYPVLEYTVQYRESDLDFARRQMEGHGISFHFRHAMDSHTLVLTDDVLAHNSIGARPFKSYDADTTMPDRRDSRRDFVYALTMPGGDLLDQNGMKDAIRAYLAHGGNPNGSGGLDKEGRPLPGIRTVLPYGLALNGNYEGLKIVLDAGADPWLPEFNEGDYFSSAVDALASSHQFALLDDLIDKGYFDQHSQIELDRFLTALGGYAQRRDEPSLEIKRIAMRVLKRNPHYVETATYDTRTRRIFKDHWNDSEPRTIPWDEIRSGRVK